MRRINNLDDAQIVINDLQNRLDRLESKDLDRHGLRVSNLGNGSVLSDAVNLGQLNDAIDQLSKSIDHTNSKSQVVTLEDWLVTVRGLLVNGARQSTSDFKGDWPSVNDWGARGNGTTDDTSAINKAISWALSNGTYLRMPSGIYLTSSTVVIPVGVGGFTLEGSSGATQQTRIKYTGTDTAVQVINPAPSAAAPWSYRVYLRNIAIFSTRGQDHTACGLDLHNVSEFELKDMVIGASTSTGFNVGLRLVGDIGVVNGLICGGHHTAVSFEWFDEPRGPIAPCTSLEFGGFCNFFHNDTVMVSYGLVDTHIHNCWFESFHTAFLMDNTLAPVPGNSMHSVTIDNCSFNGATSGIFVDNRVIKFQSSDNSKLVSVINFRLVENSCFCQGQYVVEFVTAGANASTLFEGSFIRNEFWGGTVAAITADSAIKVFIYSNQNESRSAFYGPTVAEVDPGASISVNGMTMNFGDWQYLSFSQGIKTQFASKFFNASGDAIYCDGTNKSYLAFRPDSVADGSIRGQIGFPSSGNLAYQIINNVSGQPIVLATTGGAPTRLTGGPLRTESGSGDASFFPSFAGGISGSNAGTLCWGDGTGWKYCFATSVAGVFTPRILFNDKGIIEFALGSNIYCGTGTPEANQVAPVGSVYLRTDGGASTCFYVKESGTSNTGWKAYGVPGASGAAGGDLSGTYPNPTVATVGASSAALIHSAELLANAATNVNTASTIVKRDAGGAFSIDIITHATASKVGSGVGAVNMLVGSATNDGYLEWRNAAGTRHGYLGNGTATVDLHLENSATFTIFGGGAFVDAPTNAAKAILTTDAAQTLSNKDLTATSNTFALPVIQRNDSISLTGQTASIGATNLRVGGAVAPAGSYRVSCYVAVTTAGSAGTVLAQCTWNDGASQTQNLILSNLNSTGLNRGIDIFVKVDGINDVQISTTVSGALGSPIYSIYATLERVL